MRKFKKPLLMALIISLLLSLSHPIQTEADPTAIDPNYQGTQSGGADDKGKKLDDASKYMGFYNSHEETVLKLIDGDGKVIGEENVSGSKMNQNSDWQDAYKLTDNVNSQWNIDLKEHQDWKVEFTVVKTYDIYTFNDIIGYDSKGNPLYDTSHNLSHESFTDPQKAAEYWDQQRASHANNGNSSSGSSLFSGTNRSGQYDYSNIEPPKPEPTKTPTPKPSKTPTPKPSGPIPTGATNTPTPTATATPTPTATSTPVPTATNTPTPTPPSGGIVYYGNGSTSGYTYRDTHWGGGMFIVAANTFFRRTGYHWTSWMNKPKDGLVFDVGTPINLPAYYSDNILPLYAQWAPNRSIITFHYKNEDKLKPEDLVKGTYGGSLTGGEIVAVFEDDNAPDVPYYYQTGADDKILVYDELIGELPAPTMRGYTFCGWSYIDDFYGVWLKPTALVSTWKNTDAYAYWKANVYKINFDYNFDYSLASAETSEGKLFLNDYAEITYGQQIGVGWNDSLPEPQRTGYTFEGWYIAEDPTGNGAGKKIDNGYVYDYPMDITLHAKWTPVETTIIYKNIYAVCELFIVDSKSGSSQGLVGSNPTVSVK